MTAEQAIKTLEGLTTHYKESMPKHIKQVEEAIGALKEYIRYAEGHMASLQLDAVADQVELQSPVIAMAIDRISDMLDKVASPLLAFHALRDIWQSVDKNKDKFIEEVKKIRDLRDFPGLDKILMEVTDGTVTMGMLKTSGFLVESDLIQNIKHTWDIIRKQIIETNPKDRIKKIIEMLSEKIKPILNRYHLEKRIPELSNALQKATGGIIGVSPDGTLTALREE